VELLIQHLEIFYNHRGGEEKMIEVKSNVTKLKQAYKEAVGECEMCGKKERLEVHRITPGYKGGTYIPRNCQVVCNDCHKLMGDEW